MTISLTSVRLPRTRGFLAEISHLKVGPGEALGLLGPNGSGKSTMLHLLAGILTPASGVVAWNGRPMREFSRAEWAKRVAVVPQESEAIPPMTVTEYVRLGRLPFRGLLCPFTHADTRAVDDAIERCGIRVLAHERLDQLSGGQRQRARIARAVAQGSDLLILDEPTNHLDLAARRDVALLMDELRATGTSFVASLHDLEIASYATTHIAFLREGRVEEIGPTREVLRPDTVLRYLGAAVTAVPRPGGGSAFSLSFPEPWDGPRASDRDQREAAT